MVISLFMYHLQQDWSNHCFHLLTRPYSYLPTTFRYDSIHGSQNNCIFTIFTIIPTNLNKVFSLLLLCGPTLQYSIIASSTSTTSHSTPTSVVNIQANVVPSLPLLLLRTVVVFDALTPLRKGSLPSEGSHLLRQAYPHVFDLQVITPLNTF